MATTSLLSFAQGRSVSGAVTDVGGESMINVTVQEKGVPANGTISDLDGRYTLSNLNENSILVFSYVGYLTQEIKVGNQSTVNVVLKEDQQALDEVVVVGYGTMKRRDLTGSVASVSGEKLAANPVTNIAQALQGQLPGVNVISQDGRPGATMSIRVRGGGSITQSNEPLYIVDGTPVGSIDDIPVDNVESIDVLKDAATIAIYGARGANGVIHITTKSAREGKPVVRYNAYYQAKENPRVLDVLDAYDYVLWNWSYATSYAATDGAAIAKYFGLGSANGNRLNDYKNVQTHNYVNDLMRTASSWNHDLSLSGGSANTKYYATFNYSDDEGIRILSDFKRYNANFKIEQKIAKNLTSNIDLRYGQRQITGTSFGMATSVYGYRPVDSPLGDGNAGHFGTGSANVEEDRNPVTNIENYTNISVRQRLTGTAGLTWNVLKGLTAKSELSLYKNWNTTKYWDAGNPSVSPYSEAKLTQSEGDGMRWTSTVNYDLQGLGEKNKLSVMVGNELLSSNSSESVIDGYGYPEGFSMDDAFGMINMTGYNPNAAGKDQFSYSIGTPSHTWSLFGRAFYSYLDRYLLTATLRADGSSKFAPNNRWGIFPSVATAWRISDEAFMEGSNIDNLKLRLAYGSSGNDNISPSLWKETWKTSTILVDGEQVTVYIPGEMLGNDDLSWEFTVSRNLGIDYGFLKNKIRGSIDVYWNTTKDILMKVPVDPSSGYSYQFQNVGQTSNKGVELALGASVIRTKDWRLDLNLTYNFNRNNVDKLTEGVLVDTRTGWGSTMTRPSYDYIIREGQPVGLIQGFQSEGFYTVDDFNYDAATGVYTLKAGVPDIKGITNYSANSTAGFKRPAGQTAFPGMVKFADTDKNGFVDDADKTIIGKAMPEHTGGFTINAGYKNFDFSTNFIYQIGGKIYNANAMHSMMGNKYDGMGNNRLAFIKDTYRIYDVNASGDLELVNDPNALNALNANAKYALNYNEYGLVSSQFVENASYLRLQNLTAGYTLPKTILNKTGIQNVRLYVTGANLFCLNGYSGIDPDVNTSPGGVNGFPTPNYDYNSYPKSRSYTFGLNVTF
ncbi:MAG: TonB-dependent receptor [Dysgonamonadaceae bacterium]|nr:TonB-dependent receptor [Dysgonamonadaceae bacterium]